MVAYARVVMEAHLRRNLEGHEVVHHINGDKTDDRPENLEVLSQSAHIKLHREEMNRARWADHIPMEVAREMREVLRAYAGDPKVDAVLQRASSGVVA